MEAILTTIVSVIFGAFVGTLLSYYSNKKSTEKKQKKDLCFKMYDEFHSDSMLDSRIKALRYHASQELFDGPSPTN